VFSLAPAVGPEPQSLKGAGRLETARQLPGSVPWLQVLPVPLLLVPLLAQVPERMLALRVWRLPPASSALLSSVLLLLVLLLLVPPLEPLSAQLFSVLPSVPLSWQPASSPFA